MAKKSFSPEAKFGGIVKRQLMSVKEDLTTIKGQLDGINTTLQDLNNKIAEIEKALKLQKAQP